MKKQRGALGLRHGNEYAKRLGPMIAAGGRPRSPMEKKGLRVRGGSHGAYYQTERGMEWLVTGTRDGKPGRWKLEALDASAARQKAVAGGVAVQEVRRYPVAQVATAAVDSAGAVAASEPSEPESPDDEPTVDTGHSAPADQEPTAPDDFPSGAEADEKSTALTPAPDEPRKPAATKPSRSASNRRKSIWGMAAIVVGVAGAVTGFIAPARVASIPLSGAGLLLAIAGIYFCLKRKRAGLLLPAIGLIVCAAATALVVYTGLQKSHPGRDAAVPSEQELQDRARAQRVAQANIGVQLISVRPDGGKYSLTFAYKCLSSGMSVTQLNGRLRISDASGKEIDTLAVFELFPNRLGTDPVQREGRWTLKPETAQLLQSDLSQLKVEFDPFGLQ